MGLGDQHDAVPADVVTATQVHGTAVVRLVGQPPCLSSAEGDAIISDRPASCVGVRTADCLPILLWSPGGRVVAAVHAGWRGTVAGIVTQVIEVLAEQYHIAPHYLSARFGPAIGACCYEVGEEVIQPVSARFPHWAGQVLRTSGGPRPHLDVAALNRLQLEAAGVTTIDDTHPCSQCDPHGYDSYRRDGARAGRMVSWIRVAD